jgi:hypothetical protein
MSDTLHEDEYVDEETGEIMRRVPAQTTGESGALEPTSVVTSSQLARIPETFSDLAELFTEQEPSPMEVARWILDPDQMAERDPEESARAILARILSAGTAEEVLASREVTHARDILGEAIEVHAIKWQRSDFQQGSSCYVVMHAKSLNDARDLTITCGGRNVMMQLLKLQSINALPARCRITQSAKQTSNGYLPLWLEPA